MAPLSIKIVADDGAVTKTFLFDTSTKVEEAHLLVREKILTLDPEKEYGFFLEAADGECSGVWLESGRALDYYMLRDGDYLHYLPRYRNLRLRMLDDTVKTLHVDESKKIGELMFYICSKIGVSNHEEYGLCDVNETAEEEPKASTGTLTLKRKAKEKDAELQQLIKKFKADNNVEWLDQHKTLRELRVDPKKTLLFKRRLFYSDRNVDSRDPLQLNLLYVQTRDAILEGAQVVTEEKAIEFAGLQCQIQYGDFQEDKHKPGFIENLNEFLSPTYASSWGVEKKVFREHRRHTGLSPIEAKHLYIKMARELPTYGVTFFVVKEKQKGKKKLVPRLLGITSESILRLDEETKEILQTWQLTQVKSYRAGGESFTLNFGDYSDKEYSVKTNEGGRIKDILEGYIDIIRKRLEGPHNHSYDAEEVIMEENVSSSRGSVMYNHTAQKIETHSHVGPSQIIAVEQGQNVSQGTNVTTVQQIVMSRRTNQTQHGINAIKGDFSSASKFSQDFGKKLNYLNSESVKAVVLLSDPTSENIQQVRNIAQNLEDALPDIIIGVKEKAAQMDEAEAKKHLDSLDELCAFINTLSSTSKHGDLNDPDKLMTAQNAAKKIADLSTQIYFSLDPKTRRRSKLILESRKSFIEDEKISASLRRASFLTATDGANQALEAAQEEIHEAYEGSALDEEEIRRLENDAADKMGKLNAAVAQLLVAHADPKNVDYEMAVNSMNAIQNYVPRLAQDAKLLNSAEDGVDRSELLDRINELLDQTKNICMLTGTADPNMMQEAGTKFADTSKKLMFIFGRGKPLSPNMENDEKKMKGLVMDVGNKTSALLLKVNELSQVASNDPCCEQLDKTAVDCADAVHSLLACARLTLPTIQEAHCQSALAAAIENLSSSAQSVSSSWKPLVEKPGHHVFGIQLSERSLELAKALEKLKNSFTNYGATHETLENEPLDKKAKKRLRFVTTLSSAKGAIDDANKELENLNQNIKAPGDAPKVDVKETRRRLADKLAQLNAAIASLLQATADPQNQNMNRAQRSLDTICKLTPNIVEEAASLHGSVNPNTWDVINADLKSMFEAVKDMCDNATENDGKALKENISKYAKASTNLTHTCNPRPDAKKQNAREVLELARSACQETSGMLANVYQLAEGVGGEEGQALEQAGAKVVDAAQALLRTAEVTTPSMNDSRCQASIISAVENQSELAKVLEKICMENAKDPKYGKLKENLQRDSEKLQDTLNQIKKLCHMGIGHAHNHPYKLQYLISDEEKRQKFIASLESARETFSVAGDDLQNTKIKKQGCGPKIDVLNVSKWPRQPTKDRDKINTYQAETAIQDIRELTPGIVEAVKSLNGNINGEAWSEMSEELKNMLGAARSICGDATDSNPEDINDLLSRYANSSGKLIHVFNPDVSKEKQKQILELSHLSCAQSSLLLSKVYHLAEEVGGEEGQALDQAGERIADAAHKLLTTAQITMPSLNNTRCQAAFVSALNKHKVEVKNLESKWKDIVGNPEYIHYKGDLQHRTRQLEDTIDELQNLAQVNTGIPQSHVSEKQRLKFVTNLSSAKNAIEDASKDLGDASKQKNNNGAPAINVRQTKRCLADKLSQLNAAIASLMQATADRHNPDVALAETATETIRKIAPEIVEAINNLNGNMDEAECKNINEDVKSMLEAAKEICDYATNYEVDIQDVASKFANSSGKLMFTFNPRVKARKEKQILDQSRSACEQTSVMLLKVNQLAESVGGEQGQQLDAVGAQVVDDAQTLLTTATVTAQSIEDPRCKTSLISAINRQSASMKELDKTLKPVVEIPQYQPYKDDLLKDSKSVQDTLDKLRDICETDTSPTHDNLLNLKQSLIGNEKQHLKFITTLSSAKKAVEGASKDLENITRQGPGIAPKSNAREAQKRLAEKLAQLNAAIASLIQATADAEKPDIQQAESAIEAIRTLVPDIVRDAKSVNGNVDNATWNAIEEELKPLLEATLDICGSSDENSTANVHDALSKFAIASSNLTHALEPMANIDKENQVLDLSKAACHQTSDMLLKVYELAENVGEEEGQALDLAGAKVVDGAQALLTTAEITAPSIGNAQCQSALVAAVDCQSALAKELEDTWNPIVQKTQYHQYKDDLQRGSHAVQSTLGILRDLCQDSEAEHLKLDKNLLSAKKTVEDANKNLEDVRKQDHDAGPKINVRETQRSLADKLARLNAAIASLILASSDRQNPDIELANRAIGSINELAPAVVNDVKLLKGNMYDKTWKAVTDNLKCLLEATSDICHPENKDMNEVVVKLGKSSLKLMVVLSSRNDVKKEKEVLDLSRSACEVTSAMLGKVYNLAEEVGGEEGQILDQTGAKVVDSAQALLSIAKITSPVLRNAQCQASLISAAENHSSLTKELESTWKPIILNPKYRQHRADLERDSQLVQATLDKLREMCRIDSSQRLSQQLNDCVIWDAKENLSQTEKLLDEKIKMAPTKSNTEMVAMDDPSTVPQRLLLAQKLAQLNDAIAQIVQAMSDRENQDHETAYKALVAVSQLIPEIVKDGIILDSAVESDGRMMEEAKELCKASTAVCDSVVENDVEGINRSATEYANHATKLRYILSPKKDPTQNNQILESAKSVCERTSLMLSRVSRLAELVDASAAEELDERGAAVGDTAQALLTTAQITGSSVRDNGCKSSLIASADKLLTSSLDLRKIWQPLVQNEICHPIGEQLHKDQDMIQVGVNKLKSVCEVIDEEDIFKKPAPKEKLIIEDCPLKQMAKKILLTAQAKSKSATVPPQEQKLLVDFCKNLEGALKALDIANARCRNAPMDAQRRGELEAVVMNVQQMCLFSKDLGAQESYIVDLANYINYVTSSAEDVIKATYNVTPTSDYVMNVKSECQQIIKDAVNLFNSFSADPSGVADDILTYDHFAQGCDDRLNAITEVLHDIPDSKSKIELQEKVQALKENIDLLRFATKSNLSTAMGVSFDTTLENLADIEDHIDDIVKPAPGLPTQDAETVKRSLINAQEALVSSLVSSENIPKAFAEYALHMRGAVKPDKNYNLKLKDHLKRLADLLKCQVAVRGRMVSTWQDVDGPQTTAVTDKIIQELDSFNVNEADIKPNASLAASNEHKNLLMPRNIKMAGDNKSLEDKFHKLVHKLTCNVNTMVLSCHQPESLARCLNMVSETASQVATTARSIKTDNVMASKQIEDASQHMCKATYRLLKVSQSLQRTPNDSDGRRRLQDACKSLNDSINKLVRIVLPGDSHEGEEMSRHHRMQEVFLQAGIPCSSLGYSDCLDAIQSQQDVIQKLSSGESMTKAERTESLGYVTSAIYNATEYAAQTAYLLSLSKSSRNAVERGLVDVPRLKKTTETLRGDCLSLLYCGDDEQIKHLKSEISKHTEMLQQSLDDEDDSKIQANTKVTLQKDMQLLRSAVTKLNNTTHSDQKDGIGTKIGAVCGVVDAINKINCSIDKIEEPQYEIDPRVQASSKEIMDNTKDLIKKLSSLLDKAAACDDDVMTWVMFGGNDVVKTFEKLVDCIRQKGIDAEIIAATKVQEEEVPVKSHMQIQLDLGKKWLQNPAAKPEVKEAAIRGIQYTIDLANKVTEDLSDAEKEDMKQVVTETKQLLSDCTQKYNSDKASLLMERLKELKNMLERGVVTRVVEDFLQEDPMIDVEHIVAKEQDNSKRKYILERKIAELLAQLGKVTTTGRLVADTGSGHARRDLINTSNQVELLAPNLVKAAQKRLETPDDKEAIEEYMALLEQYAKAIASMRELCDKAVDPIDFAQAAGETMHRINEENSVHNDPQTCSKTSRIILRLGHRVVDVGMNSDQVKKDPEMQTTLTNIRKSIQNQSGDQAPDWKAIFAEILQKTSQVEAVLGGENIFNRQPEPDQPIYAAALDLHAAVREWSARDNDIVANAKRMAVLMAKLSHNMETGNKRELLITSKAIVAGAAEVATLARKMALECTDMRIRTNLLQVCDKIPTISGQLKILTTVKGSSLGHQGSTEDQEAMNMLVCNAQNLMTSIQEVVKAAASASVKIMSQRGPRMKWVRRRNYY